MVTSNLWAIVILLEQFPEDNSQKEDEMEIAESESQPSHGDQQFVSYPNENSDRGSCNSKQEAILDKDFDEGNRFSFSIKIKRNMPVK